MNEQHQEPVHNSLIRPVLLQGAERSLFYINVLVAAPLLAFSKFKVYPLLYSGLTLLIGHRVAVALTRRDTSFREVYLRATLFRKIYLSRPTLDAEKPLRIR